MAGKKDFYYYYSTMIFAFANHSLVEKAVYLFEPNEVTFLGVIEISLEIS